MRWFYKQTLMGDSADNYKGCPGVGPVKADKILKEETDEKVLWGEVVNAFEKAGLTEEDAIENARLAYLLKDGDYNFETKEVTLWQPPTQ